MFTRHISNCFVLLTLLPTASSHAAEYVITQLQDSHYKSNFQQANRGNLVGSFTPKSFSLQLDFLNLYNLESNCSFSLLQTLNGSAGILPRHVDIVGNRNFVRSVDAASSACGSGVSEYDGLVMQFLPGISQTNDYMTTSVIEVDLGEAYKDVTFSNEESTLRKVDSTVHHFAFSEIQPVNVSFLSYLVVGADVENSGVQNPESANGSWSIPGGFTTSGNSSQLFFAGKKINFTGIGRPQLKFSWDVSNLVEVYDAGTAGVLEDDVVSLKLSAENPFSTIVIDVVASLADEDFAGNLNDGAIDNVSGLKLTGLNSRYTLQWTNPTDETFSTVRITRKTGSAPATNVDGDSVYDGYEPVFEDPEGTADNDYYYRVYAVDAFDNESPGQVIRGQGSKHCVSNTDMIFPEGLVVPRSCDDFSEPGLTFNAASFSGNEYYSVFLNEQTNVWENWALLLNSDGSVTAGETGGQYDFQDSNAVLHLVLDGVDFHFYFFALNYSVADNAYRVCRAVTQEPASDLISLRAGCENVGYVLFNSNLASQILDDGGQYTPSDAND